MRDAVEVFCTVMGSGALVAAWACFMAVGMAEPRMGESREATTRRKQGYGISTVVLLTLGALFLAVASGVS